MAEEFSRKVISLTLIFFLQVEGTQRYSHLLHYYFVSNNSQTSIYQYPMLTVQGVYALVGKPRFGIQLHLL
jgi:hypothetical protein